MKRLGIGILRTAVILLLCTGLALGWLALAARQTTGTVEAIFVGTRQDADCTILLSGDWCVVIDTGEEEDGEHILEILQQKQVDRIDCLILTHPDKDHVGGAAALVEQMPVREVIAPYYEGDKEAYNNLVNLLQQRGIPKADLARERQLVFGELELELFPPKEYYYADSNDYSIAVLARHGQVHLVFTGDAEKERLQELLELSWPEQVDLYKVSHHGRDSGKSAEMIQRLSPKMAVVTAKAPEPEIAAALEQAGSQVFCTVGQDAAFVSDGSRLAPVTE